MTPLLDLFRRGDVPREVRLLAAQGALAPRAHEQLELLVLLTEDGDPGVAATALETVDALPAGPLGAFLARADVPIEVRAFFAARGVVPGPVAAPDDSGPLVEADHGPLPDVCLAAADSDDGPPGEELAGASSRARPLSSLPVTDRLKLAMRGSREQRAVLIHDASRLVATAVLSSPKLTKPEVESFARMANVSDDVLRIIGTSRAWTKNYMVVSALVRNPRTPIAIALSLSHRLNARDLKMLSVDRNVPEAVRLAARKYTVAQQGRDRGQG